MSRRMSFSLTEPQFLDGTKDVTRRLGWATLRAGDEIVAVRKCMGLRKGERQTVLGRIHVVSVRAERLDAVTPEDVRREGFPDLTPAEFVDFFCRSSRCSVNVVVTRIEFRKVAP